MSPEQEILTSIHNPLIQLTRSLLNDRSAREENRLYIAEGLRLCTEAKNAALLPRFILYSQMLSVEGKKLLEDYQTQNVRMVALAPGLMERVSATESSQGILMALPILPPPLPKNANLVLILDQLRDPGNLGTILRSAAAAAVDLVFLTPGCVDLYMPKVVRSAMGAHFRLNIHASDWREISDYCLDKTSPPLRILAAESGGGNSLWTADLRSPLALVIGGEAEGPSPEAKRLVVENIHIPMPGNFESLNAGVAASILLFEIIRQRKP